MSEALHPLNEISFGPVGFPVRTSLRIVTMLPRVPVKKRLHVVTILLNGASQRKTAKTVGIAQATVNRILLF